jgi:cyanophycinase
VSESRGPLVVIGGHEDREGERVILKEVARHLRGRKLLLCAAASRSPEKYLTMYRTAFADLGVEVIQLDASNAHAVSDGAGGVFLSGGKQGRLVQAVSGTAIERAIREIWDGGGVIAGTSAGASALGETMLARGAGDETPSDDDVQFATGLGLIAGVIIDQHFAERGRIGRLATAVATRPDLVGLGIDEDTAIVIAAGRMEVIGDGGVYVLDGSENSDGLRFHLLSSGDEFALARSLHASRLP